MSSLSNQIPSPLSSNHEPRLRTMRPSKKMTQEVPKLCQGASQAEFLNFIVKFSDAWTTMGWMTGLKLYSKFVVHLMGTDKTVRSPCNSDCFQL